MKTNVLKRFSHLTRLSCAFGLLFLGAFTSGGTSSRTPEGFEVKFLAGSALKQYCAQVANQFNHSKPKLDNLPTLRLLLELPQKFQLKPNSQI